MKRLGRVYADSFDLGRAIFRESKKLSNSDLRAQIHVILTFEEMLRDERNEEMKVRWLLAVASELHRLERIHPEDDEERQMKAACWISTRKKRPARRFSTQQKVWRNKSGS